MKQKYISPFTDFGFKKLFGTEVNKSLLLDFLNELLKRETGKITSLSYLTTEQLGRKNDDRRAIFDIYCENESGEKFIVELQKARQNYFKDRSVFYSTFPIQQQAERGDSWDFELKAIYTVGILDFVFEEDKDDEEVFHHEVKMVNIKTGKVFYDKLTYIYLEMPKFTKREEELETRFDKWLYLLKNLHNFPDQPQGFHCDIFTRLFDEAEIAHMTHSEYCAYQESVKVYRDMKNVVDTAWGDGKTDGLAEGLAKGLAKGRAEGLAEGLGQVKETAARMKAKGFSAEEIQDLTGLSLSDIESL